MKQRYTPKAFTLLELIVTIVILAILAALAIPTFSQVLVKTKLETAEVTASSIAREALALSSFNDQPMTEADVVAAVKDLPRKIAYTEGLSAADLPSEYNVVFGKWEFSGGINTVSASLQGAPKGESLGVSIGLPGVGCAFAKTDGRNVTSWSKAGMDVTSCNGSIAFVDEEDLDKLKAPPVPDGLSITFGSCTVAGEPGWEVEFTSGLVDVFVNGVFIGTFASGSCIPGSEDDEVTVVENSPEGGWPGAPGDIFGDEATELPGNPGSPGTTNPGPATPPVSTDKGNNVIISWPSSTPGNVIIERSPVGGSTWKPIPVMPPTNKGDSDFVTDAPGDGDFIYRGEAGGKPLPIVTDVATPPATLPADPETGSPVGVTLVGDTAILAWGEVEDRLSAPLSGYKVYRSLNGGTAISWKANLKGETTATDPGLKPGEYCYQVSSYGLGGESARTPKACVTLVASVSKPNFSSFSDVAPLFGTFKGDFGNAISLQGDMLVVSAPSEAGAQASEGGVHVYTKRGASWAPQAHLLAPDPILNAQFGASLASSGDTIVVGAPGATDRGTNGGAVYTFTRSGENWSTGVRLTPPVPMTYNVKFGSKVAIHGDTLVVTSVNAVYVFNKIGNSWVYSSELVASDKSSGSNFGSSIALDANTIVVGADNEGVLKIGSVYVFTRSGSAWVQTDKLQPYGMTIGSRFGTSSSIDGDTLVIGAPNFKSNTGAAFVYTKGSDGRWGQVSKLQSPISGDGAYFGISVSAGGGRVAVGAHKEYALNVPSTGYVYVFTPAVEGWSEVESTPERLTSSTTGAPNGMGYRVVLDANTLVVKSMNQGVSSFNIS